MQPTTIGFFDEAPGHKSSMRLFSFILLLFFCAFSFYYVASKGCELNADFIAFEMVQLVAVFAPKYLQKVAEMKLGALPGKPVAGEPGKNQPVA